MSYWLTMPLCAMLLCEEMLQYSVHTLLRDAGRRCCKHPATSRGQESDHIVELQLVKTALNKLPKRQRYSCRQLGALVDFFNSTVNVQYLPRGQNELKREAVFRMIQRARPQPGDIQWINCVREKWLLIRNRLSTEFSDFKRRMDAVVVPVVM
jgi:hypothetical protein